MAELIVERFTPTDPRLGRHVEHDPRSRDFAFKATKPKEASWVRRAPILDQGQLGSCTGNALAGLLGTDSAARTGAVTIKIGKAYDGIEPGLVTIDEALATALYGANTKADSYKGTYPPDDTGSSSLACGKVGKLLGVFEKYSHCFSMTTLKAAIGHGPVLFGTVWYNSMFDPDKDGNLTVDAASGVAGGHELVIGAWQNGMWRIDNSWGESWGHDGSGYIKDADMEHLLGQKADFLVPTFVVGV